MLPNCDCGTCCETCGHDDDCIRHDDDSSPAMTHTSTAREDVERWLIEPYDKTKAQLLDAYRDQVLAEGAELIRAASVARLEEISEDDRRPSHWERHGEWCDAAELLLAARTIQEN